MSSSKEEDVEVRYEDQEKINEFGRINNTLLEIRADIKQAKLDCDKLKDATSELEMVIGGKIMILIGEFLVLICNCFTIFTHDFDR